MYCKYSDHFKDECGVFGIFGTQEASVLTTLGLHSLQHRGQEGAGIVSFDGKSFPGIKLSNMKFFPSVTRSRLLVVREVK